MEATRIVAVYNFVGGVVLFCRDLFLILNYEVRVELAGFL